MTPALRDRAVHARYTGMEVVQYNRTGKWYLEPMDQTLRRQHVTIREAVEAARHGLEHLNGHVDFHLPGGLVFDRMMEGLER